MCSTRVGHSDPLAAYYEAVAPVMVPHVRGRPVTMERYHRGIDIDGVRFILVPRGPPDDENENNNTIPIRLEFGAFSMLFIGDGEEGERDWLVANHPALLDVDVLKASHHGSRNGTSNGWLAAVTPARVVLSAGLHGGFKHPHGEAVTAYEAAVGGDDRVYCTNRHGTVTIYGFPDGRIRVTRQRVTNKSCGFDGTLY